MKRTTRLHWLRSLGILIMGALILVSCTQVVVEGWDPVAYLYAGQQLAQGKSPSFCSPLNAEIGPYFTLAGFNIRRGNDLECLFLNYPPGFPIMLAIAQKLSGKPETALYVPAVLGVLALLFTFVVGTLLFDKPEVGLIGAFLLLCAPTFLQFSTSPWSDVPATSLLMGGVMFVVIGERLKVRFFKIIAGLIGALLIGWSFFTRYSNLLALFPLVMYLTLKYKTAAFKEGQVISFAVCTVCVALGVLLFNRIYFGGYLSTSYSPAHGWYNWPAFSVRYAFGSSPVGGRSLIGAIQTLISNYSWLLLLAGIGFWLMPWPERALMFGNVVIFVSLYSLYAFAPVGINARFLLPTFPAIGISIGYALTNLVPDNWSHWWYRSGLLIVIATMLIPLPGHLQKLLRRNLEALAYVEKIISLAGATEHNSVFLAYNANDAIAYYGRRTTLFYRRIPWKDLADFERNLVAVCESLLKKRISVYFVVDREPPLWDILSILRRHFNLISLSTDPPLYSIQLRS